MFLALGAGGVYAAKHGRGALRRAVGWTAERAGFITGRIQETLAETRRLARERYDEGVAATRARAELESPASARPRAAANGAHAVANGDSPPT
jgi:hypothetical protein